MAQLLHTYTKLICHIHNSHKSQLSHYTCDKKMLVVCACLCVCTYSTQQYQIRTPNRKMIELKEVMTDTV